MINRNKLQLIRYVILKLSPFLYICEDYIGISEI